MYVPIKIFKLYLIITLISLAFLGNTAPITLNSEFHDTVLTSSLQITAKTDQQTYLLRQKITIEGNITQDGTPASDLLVIIQVENPKGTPIAYRTLTIGEPTQTWLVNITNIFLMDMSGNMINTAKIGTQIQVGVTVHNYQVTPRDAYITVTLFDANMVPLQVGYWIGTLEPRETISPRFSIYIPKSACTGKALITANVYDREPKEGGTALCPEKTIYFCLSKAQQGLFEYPSLPPPPPQTTPGAYNTYLRVSPDPMAGEYTIYVTAQAGLTLISSTSTTFNVENSWGYPPQASFIYWPASPYENMTVKFDASSSTAEGFNDTIIRYEWDFGDGTPKVIKEGNPPDPTVTHRYLESNQYIITLNVTDSEGLWSTTSKPITVYPEFGPSANFTWTPETPRVNNTVTFNASSSKEGWSKLKGDYSPIISYTWNFSDGTGNITVTEPLINHTFTQPGNYTVTLTVIDDVGRTDSITKKIEILNVTAKELDLNGDNVIDGSDLIIVARAYGSYPGHPDWNPIADINKDDVVDGSDMIMVARHYGEDP